MVFGTVSVRRGRHIFLSAPEPLYAQRFCSLPPCSWPAPGPKDILSRSLRLLSSSAAYGVTWSRLKIYGPISTLCVLLIFLVTRTSQSGILLYASLIHFSPPHLATAPGLAEIMQPFQARAIQGKNARRKHIKLRKDMASAMTSHLETQGLTGRALKAQISNTFQQAGIEIAIRNFWRLPELAVEKFFIGHQ